MISRYIFVCLYFISFFIINRWYDFYQYYFHVSTRTLFSNQIIPVNQLNVKQLQYILNLRGIGSININEKYDLIQMVQQTGEFSSTAGEFESMTSFPLVIEIYLPWKFR